MGEGGNVLGGQLHQVIALQRIFRGPHDTLGHVSQQVFPLLQVTDGGRDGHQFAVGAARDRFAMYVTDMPPEQPRGAGGGLILPAPIADIEGHFDG
ncbi:hypothetical protein D3C73_1327430 [compost metagenome]